MVYPLHIQLLVSLKFTSSFVWKYTASHRAPLAPVMVVFITTRRSLAPFQRVGLDDSAISLEERSSPVQHKTAQSLSPSSFWVKRFLMLIQRLHQQKSSPSPFAPGMQRLGGSSGLPPCGVSPAGLGTQYSHGQQLCHLVLVQPCPAEFMPWS